MTNVEIRSASGSDVEFLARIDLKVDADTGEVYHLGWGEEQRAAHAHRIAWFTEHRDGVAFIGEAAGLTEDSRIAMLLARIRDLRSEPRVSTPDMDMFVDTLWPCLPPGWEPRDGRFVEVFQLWVHPSQRRRGIATALKRRLDDVAHDRGLELVYTHTRASHHHVIALNEKLGYRAFRTGPLWDEVPRVSLAKRMVASAR